MERYKKLKVVVTGGGGFIGSHLVEKLLAIGAEVTVVDNFQHGDKIEHLRGHENLTIYEGDVRDSELIHRIFKDINMVFHLAAIVGVEQTQMRPLDVLDVEINGTINVLNSVLDNGINRIIFASSSEVYGDSSKAMSETDPLFPKSTYSVAKIVGEEYCKAFYQRYGIEYCCLRYFNVYGARQDERFVISSFIGNVLSNEAIQIYGDGMQTRDFTYIDDAVNMSLLAGITADASCQVINIGTGVATTMRELAHIAKNALNGNRSTDMSYCEYGGNRPREIEVLVG